MLVRFPVLRFRDCWPILLPLFPIAWSPHQTDQNVIRSILTFFVIPTSRIRIPSTRKPADLLFLLTRIASRMMIYLLPSQQLDRSPGRRSSLSIPHALSSLRPGKIFLDPSRLSITTLASRLAVFYVSKDNWWSAKGRKETALLIPGSLIRLEKRDAKAWGLAIIHDLCAVRHGEKSGKSG